jgi:hypothetical protein
MTTAIMVEIQKERKVTAATILRDPRLEAELSGQQSKYLRIIESPWMPMSLETQVPQITDLYLNRTNVCNKRGCDSVLTTIVATPNGRMGLCCGLTRELIPELNVEINPDSSIREIYRIASYDFLKIWLFVEGPERILAWAATKDSTIEWENKYAHHCHACLALFKDKKVRNVIEKYYKEKVKEVLLRYILLVKAGGVEAPDLALFKST